MFELLISIFNALIGLPFLLWDIITGVWATAPMFTYFIGLGVIYAILSLSRSVGPGVLILFSILGMVNYFIYWTFYFFSQQNEMLHHEIFFLSFLFLLILALPMVIFIYRTPAGRGITVMDGFALGAMLGIGYYVIQHLHFNFPLGQLLSLPAGSYEPLQGYYNTPFNALSPMIADMTMFTIGPPAISAFLGATLVLCNKLSSRTVLWPIPFLALFGFLYLEVNTLSLVTAGLQGEAGSFFWHTLIGWYNTISFGGRLSGTLFILLYLVILVRTEMILWGYLKENDWARLPEEAGKPNVFTEILMSISAVRYGLGHMSEVWGFFAARRRVATMEFVSKGARVKDDPKQQIYLEFAIDAATDRKFRALAALKGDPVNVEDKEGEARWKTFLKGLVLALIGSYIYLSLVSHLGLLISTALGQRLGNGGDPMGYVYATVLVSGLVFAVAFYREKISGWLAFDKIMSLFASVTGLLASKKKNKSTEVTEKA